MTRRYGPGLRRGRLVDAAEHSARNRLLESVLDMPPDPEGDGTWVPFTLFDAEGVCVANVDAALLPLVADDVPLLAAGIRSVAVDPGWRGRGLFRALMTEALAWCDARASAPTFLYTAEPALYEPFGFGLLAQHAVFGPPPEPRGAADGLLASVEPPDPPAHLAAMVARRAPISRRAALMVDTPLFLRNLAGADAPSLLFAPSIEAAIAFEEDGDTLVIADIAAARIPSLAEVLGALGRRPGRIKTLFPPDCLAWQGELVREDTGLMARGQLPMALTRPFMFPPTAEF